MCTYLDTVHDGGKKKFFECMENENVMMVVAVNEQTTTNVCSNNGGNLSSHSFSYKNHTWVMKIA